MSEKRIKIDIPMNRVEGDLEIKAELEGGRVVAAWCAGTLFRGIERMLTGRGGLDGLVITPRICGVCSQSHLSAAARALDAIAGAAPPPGALKVRHLTLMVEHAQSDMRQAFLMYAADFANPAYADSPLYPELLRRYEPLKGETAISVIQETRKVLEIVAILGGQWPHTSYIVPGGITSLPSLSDLTQCRFLLQRYRQWYERRILGCSLERWAAVRGAEDLDAWLEESPAHADSDLGLFIRVARQLGLDRTGRGHGHFLSFGGFELPEGSRLGPLAGGQTLLPAGFLRAGAADPGGFAQENVLEHVAHSWFVDYEGGRHPFRGETRPYASGDEQGKYTWAKAPRYDGLPAETGPLAEMLLAGIEPVAGLVRRDGPSAFTRQLARILRPALLLPAMETLLAETDPAEAFYQSPGPMPDGEGFGLIEAARGALGHWVRVEDGRIAHYQIITPTAWNASPRDSAGVCGPIEQALVGCAVADPANPVELGHVVRSFDPCLVCTVHTLQRGRAAGRLTVGARQ